jgi:hypothetical protein
MSGKHKAKYKKLAGVLPKGKLDLYVGSHVRDAIIEVTTDFSMNAGL